MASAPDGQSKRRLSDMPFVKQHSLYQVFNEIANAMKDEKNTERQASVESYVLFPTLELQEMLSPPL
jgi:hypothetical protein